MKTESCFSVRKKGCSSLTSCLLLKKILILVVTFMMLLLLLRENARKMVGMKAPSSCFFMNLLLWIAITSWATVVWVKGKEEWHQDLSPEGITGTNYWQFELLRFIYLVFKWHVLLCLVIWDLGSIWEKQYNAVLNWYKFLYRIFITSSLEGLKWNKNLLSGSCPICWDDCMQGKQRSSCSKLTCGCLFFFNTVQLFFCILLKTPAYCSCKVSNFPSEQLFVFYFH